MTIRGFDHLRAALGQRLTGVRRQVLGLGRASDAFGHGITELTFERVSVVVRPGPDEDYLIVEEGPLDASSLDREFWSEVDLVQERGWKRSGILQGVEVFTDGVEDVALLFGFDSGERFSLVLCDGDAAVGHKLERFALDPNQVRPALRTRLGA